MIHIRTPSRLHFGLFCLPSTRAPAWLNQAGQPTLPRRHFGGVGLMIDRPGIELVVAQATTWSAEGPLAERALSFAQKYCASASIPEPFHLRIESAAPEHAGLGTGTQLGLAVARALAALTRQPAHAAVALARQVGRGLRSALGIHGFEHGGFLVEGGKNTEGAVAPLLTRHDFPPEWEILLVLPAGLQGAHGRREVEAFADLATQERHDRLTETLCRLVLLHLLPALLERDLTTFGEALHDFNRRVGILFQPAQGGLYAHPRIEHIITLLREAGVRGVGQSSWGPSIFAVGMAGQAADLGDWLIRKHQFRQEEIQLARACNHGAELVLPSG